MIGDMEQSEKSEPESDNEPSMANLLAGEWSKKSKLCNPKLSFKYHKYILFYISLFYEEISRFFFLSNPVVCFIM